MARALQLARRGQGRVEPNPMVGCVLVGNGRVLAEGFHRYYGGPHAEVEALRRAAKAGVRGVRGCTAYVTLEPCNHHGKTPPCTEALIAAGVGRVIAAHRDPFPQVAGNGFRRLREAGVEVASGLLADEAAELNAPFLTRVVSGRPYVIAKWAQSLDGKIATPQGDSKWISGEPARRLVHRLRARVDAIAVGLNTVLADDPQLTARDVPLRRVAARVVFDSRLRIPRDARLVATALATPTWVMTTHDAFGRNASRVKSLTSRGVEVIPCRSAKGRVAIPDALKKLAQRGCTNLLVEGGSELFGAFQDAGAVDELMVFTAPVILGGRAARTPIAGLGAGRVAQAVRLRQCRTKRVGNDLLTVARLTTPPLQLPC
jgi:diaminohydroxyphosphoribosylaminopyrimidine deaminase/5-amino-6-(5-phosphoribosylamino)uracil reductase